MPPETVTIRRRGHDGTTTETTEHGGGVFHPLPEKDIRMPAWLYGPKKDRPLYTCPVSAIGADVLDLYRLWMACDMTKTLPLAGGLLDQPDIVQRAFPYFVDETHIAERGPS